jgi:hypothetical protein
LGKEPVDVLYDCRFLVQFNIAEMPEEIARAIADVERESRVVILSNTQWSWPKVWWWKKGEMPVALAGIGMVDKDHETLASNWISIKWIRVLDAT